MHIVIVVPGIMGTELLLPTPDGIEKVWPPTPLETQLGYKRTQKLASAEVKPGGIITRVACFDFYQPLLDLLTGLGFTADGAAKRQIEFPYDWRRDLFDLADDLGELIAHEVAKGATRVSLVAHSMGGLISRLLLEDPRFRTEPWFGLIDQLIAIATPHLGAPLALGRVLGQDSAMGISGADFAWLASREEYPSAYQLLPAPGEGSCWDQSDQTDPPLAPIDIYDAAGIALLKLNTRLIARAQAVHAVLGAGNRPDKVRYFYFSGTGHRTVTRINIVRKAGGDLDLGETVLTRTEDGGDGTVPLYSALPRPGQRAIVTNEHATAFKGVAFRRTFVRLLGGNEGPAVEAGLGQLAMSVESPMIAADQSVELLIYPDGPEEMPASIEQLSGDLVLVRVLQEEKAKAQDVRRVPLHYEGPALSRLRLYLDPIGEPGHYEVRLENGDYRASTAFSVCAPLPTADGTAQ
tara:strand:+ start:1083 stop:2474 length:1392 start_codon:yes stop_codon:yes gene_type:complete